MVCHTLQVSLRPITRNFATFLSILDYLNLRAWPETVLKSHYPSNYFAFWPQDGQIKVHLARRHPLEMTDCSRQNLESLQLLLQRRATLQGKARKIPARSAVSNRKLKRYPQPSTASSCKHQVCLASSWELCKVWFCWTLVYCAIVTTTLVSFALQLSGFSAIIASYEHDFANYFPLYCLELNLAKMLQLGVAISRTASCCSLVDWILRLRKEVVSISFVISLASS